MRKEDLEIGDYSLYLAAVVGRGKQLR